MKTNARNGLPAGEVPGALRRLAQVWPRQAQRDERALLYHAADLISARYGALTVDLEHNVAVFEDGEIHLAATEAELLSILNRTGRASHAEIAAGVWGHSEGPENELDNIKAWIWRLRRKLAPIGIEIVNYWGHGYGIRWEDAKAKPSARKVSSA